MSTATSTSTPSPSKPPSPMPAPDISKHKYQLIPVDQLKESKTNPRQHYAKEELQELTDSVRTFGVIEPLIVRPQKGDKASFEIISGSRRYRATKAAGLAEAPCIVREATDGQVLELHIIENLQRADLHPMEEAQGYEAMMSPPHRMKVEQLADRIKKSVKYVYDRRKLLDLIKPVQKVFLDNEITAGHAILLARIPAEHQKRILEAEVDGLFYPERVLRDPETEELIWNSDDAAEEPRGRRCISVRELEAIIDRTVRFTPKDAVQHAIHYPETVKALEEQPKDEKVLAITYEHVIRDTARDSKTRTLGPRSWTRADGQFESKTCDHSELGLVVAGPRRGEAFQVCRAKEKCLVHYGKEIKDKQRREKAHAEGKPSDRAKQQAQDARRQQKEEAQRLRQEAERKTWEKAVPDILDAIAKRVLAMPTKAGGYLAQTIMEEIDRNGSTMVKPLKTPGSSAEDVVRQGAFLVLAGEARDSYWGRQNFPKKAKYLGIDLPAILKAHAKAEKPAKAEAKKAKA